MTDPIRDAGAPPSRRQHNVLQTLIVACRDDGAAYRNAAASPGRDHDELLALSRRRSSFAETLSGFARRAGGGPRRHGSILARARRSILGLRTILQGHAHHGDSLLACVQEEERAAARYRTALEMEWSPEIGAVLSSQLEEIEKAHTSMRARL